MTMPPDLPSLLDDLGYAYFEIDLSGVFTAANASLCQALGRPRAEVIGQPYHRLVDHERVRDVADAIETAHRTGQAVGDVVYPLRRSDGSLLMAEGAISLIRDESGRVVGFRGLAHDVTDRLRDAAAVQRARDAAERELDIGRRIQAGFLPRELPVLPGWEIAGRFQAAREVAGDFYDAFTLSGGKRVGLVIGDVCDKGVGAALFMALFRSLLRAFADQHYSLGWMDVLSSDAAGSGSVGRRRSLLSTGATALKNAVDLTNRYIVRNHGYTSMFATIFFGVLDPATGALLYINAGHEPPAVIGPDGVRARLEPTGPAVGLFDGVEFGIDQVDLQIGDTWLAFTDGVPDARDPQGQHFSEQRLLDLARQAGGSVGGLLDRICADLDGHMAGAVQFDDVTLLAARRVPPSSTAA